MWRRHFAVLPIVLALVVGKDAGSAPSCRGHAEEDRPPAPSICRSVDAVGIPAWVTTGVWKGEALLVVDSAEKKFVQISKTGIASELQAAIGDYLRDYKPTRIRAGSSSRDPDAQFVVELAGGKLLNLDRTLSPRKQFKLATSELESGDNRIATLIDWILAGDDVVGYADIQGPGGRKGWKNAFVRFKLDWPESFRITREQSYPDNARVAMTLTYPLMASIGDTAYVALVGDQMRLSRFDPEDRELQPMRAFPAHLNGLPAPMLPSWLEKEEFPRVMEEVEKSSMPAGLWAWNDSLYLLSRAFGKSGREWYLSRIDPKLDELVWTVRVPGDAHHMTVIPGPNEWAFLEKGPVTHWLNQETSHIIFVASSQLQSQSLNSLCQ